MLWRNLQGAGGARKGDPAFNLDRMSETDRQTGAASFYQRLSFAGDGTQGFMSYGGDGTLYLDPFSCSAYALDVTLSGYTAIGASGYTTGYIRGVFARKDGTKVFFGDNAGDLNSIDLSIAWDPASTVTHNQEQFDAISGGLQGIHFLDDGKTAYCCGYDGGYSANIVKRYTMTTAWDLSTAATDSVDSTVVHGNVQVPRGIWVDQNEDWLFVVDQNTGDIYSFKIPADGDLAKLSFDTKYDQASTFPCQDFDLKPDGTKLFQIDTSSDDLIEYSFS